MFQIVRFESDYYGFHFINILGACDLPIYSPETRFLNLTKFERNFNIVQLTNCENFKMFQRNAYESTI